MPKKKVVSSYSYKPTERELTNPTPSDKGEWLQSLMDWAFDNACRRTMFTHRPKINTIPQPYEIKGRRTKKMGGVDNVIFPRHTIFHLESEIPVLINENSNLISPYSRIATPYKIHTRIVSRFQSYEQMGIVKKGWYQRTFILAGERPDDIPVIRKICKKYRIRLFWIKTPIILTKVQPRPTREQKDTAQKHARKMIDLAHNVLEYRMTHGYIKQF